MVSTYNWTELEQCVDRWDCKYVILMIKSLLGGKKGLSKKKLLLYTLLTEHQINKSIGLM
jgi:hypothetical protein